MKPMCSACKLLLLLFLCAKEIPMLFKMKPNFPKEKKTNRNANSTAH